MYGNSSNAAAAAAIRISRIGAALAGIFTDLSASVGTRLISRVAFAANQKQTNHGEVHQP